jgi:hypothetical protein
VLYSILMEFWVSMKLVRLVKMLESLGFCTLSSGRVQCLKSALSKGPKGVGESLLSPEDINKSSF